MQVYTGCLDAGKHSLTSSLLHCPVKIGEPATEKLCAWQLPLLLGGFSEFPHSKAVGECSEDKTSELELVVTGKLPAPP